MRIDTRGASPPSPCNEVCELDPATRTCRGCLRLLEEIETWASASADEKRAVLRRIEDRRQAAT